MSGGGEQWGALLPEGLLLLGAVAGLLVGLWTPQHRQARVRWVVTAACLAAAAVAAARLPGPGERVFDGVWVVDTTTGVVRVVVALAVPVLVWLAVPTLAGHPRETEAWVLMVLGGLGAVALAGAGDLLLLVAGYLLASVPLYALAGFAKDAPGVEAAMKYYLFGAFSGVLLLLGVAGLVLAGGAGGYEHLAGALPGASPALVAVGVLGVLAGVGFKAGAVPVHFWVPDVAAGTPPAVAAYLTTVPKIGAVAAAYRLVDEPLAGAPVDVPLVVAVVAAASMTLGNLAALAQTHLLRLLAYSTVSQVGYLFMVVAVAGRSALAPGALAVYLAGYAVTNVGAFAAVAAAPAARTITDWATAVGRHRWLVVSLVVCLLGLVGTPPTAVFVGKLAVFAAAWDGGLAWLVVLAAVNTVASLFYYLRWFAPAFAGVAAAPGVGEPGPGSGPRTAAGTAQRIRPGLPVGVLHAAAAGSLALGLAAGGWLAVVA
ncbi:NADH-quinone oxidoreductase subunit N [Geodermatophilus marinus]|uniref:NADH-quinone oxidoreductase subunit N n=1 Tax=Geodermatophilus sp. LHW52908 TaxID=2303986 RepID=UPI000E3DE588|nr:proton-conducting transporter membrane subunit [Geodermatophilus sp. LHW52908]RFU21744.1 NADH-quinone oxidoreductase subunit N [Geodermatophilus sp. LHW52908]